MKRATRPAAKAGSTPDASLFLSSIPAQVAGDWSAALVSGFDAIRKVQDEAVRATTARHAGAFAKMKAGSPVEMISVQAELLRADMEAAAACSQGVLAAALEMQSQLVVACSRLVDSEAVLEATAALEALTNALPLRGVQVPST
jgi:hypothetical protein